MNSICSFPKRLSLSITDSRYLTRVLFSNTRNYSDDGKSKKDEERKKITAAKTESAKKKLNDLLKSIVTENPPGRTSAQAEKKSIEFQLAGNARKKNLEKYEVKVEEKPKVTSPDSQPEPPKPSQVSEGLSPELVKAVKTVAGALEGDPSVTENELVQKLKTQTARVNMSELFVGMKIDRKKERGTAETEGGSRADYVRQQMREQPAGRSSQRFAYTPKQQQEEGREERRGQGQGEREGRGRQQPRERSVSSHFQYRSVGLFQSKPIGLFSITPTVPEPEVPKLKTWDATHRKELKLAVTHPPANGFEEMILWTEKGKLWKFPIDNEQDYGAEAEVSFQDHVFLTPHLDPWCPKKGPIRHFMEVVCTALGKNSYLTAKEKRECIEWYHSYFMKKSTIIKEIGAGSIG